STKHLPSTLFLNITAATTSVSATLVTRLNVCRPRSTHTHDPYALASPCTLSAVNSIQRTGSSASTSTAKITSHTRTLRRFCSLAAQSTIAFGTPVNKASTTLTVPHKRSGGPPSLG